MAGIYGFSSLVLDTKGRIAMPAKYKDQLKNLAGGSIIVTRDPQYPSLLIYPGNLWKKISSSFEELSGLNPEIRSLQWNFLGNAHYIDFDISVFTNLSSEHLDYHNDMETYFRAKSKLFRMMPITSTSIVNVDDEYGVRIKNESSAPVISISTKNKSDIFYKKINYSLSGINGIIRGGNEEISFNSRLIGEFNAENIISAASVGIALNIGLKNIENGINNVKVIDGRMEIFKTTDNKNIIVDHNAIREIPPKIPEVDKTCKIRLCALSKCGLSSLMLRSRYL